LKPEEMSQTDIRSIDPAFGPIMHMKKLRERGDIAVVKDDEKTVGMVGFEYCRTDPESGRNVYEMRRLGVYKDYEGRGIGTALQKRIAEKVRSMDPTAILLVETKNPRISSQCRKMGFQRCSMEEWLRLKYEDAHDAYADEESTFWVYDPPITASAFDVE
jgi:GNAT superfamily N-acetyltransferase